MSFLEFVNEYNGFFLAVFSLIVALATCLYAYLTFKLLKETKKLRQPDIFLIIQENELWQELTELIIQNTGLGPAYNVKISCDPDFKMHENMMFSELNFIKSGFRYVGPNQKIRVATLFVDSREKESIIGAIKFIVTYTDNTNKQEKHEFFIDLNEYAKLNVSRRSWKYEIEKHLKKIADNIPSIPSDLGKISEKLIDLRNEIRSLSNRIRL